MHPPVDSSNVSFLFISRCLCCQLRPTLMSCEQHSEEQDASLEEPQTRGRGGHLSPVTVLEVMGKRRETLECGDKL